MNDDYKIYAKTKTGMLNGMLKLRSNNNQLTGIVSLGGKDFTFYNGKVNQNCFSFSGNFKFYFKRINYTANGEIDGDNIKIVVNSNMGVFNIDGKKI